MKTIFVSALTLYVRLTLCSFLCCIGAEQCGVMMSVSSQGDYLESVDNIVADFKAKCRQKTVVLTSGTTAASLTTEISKLTSVKLASSTNPTTSSVPTQHITVKASPGWPLGLYGLPMPTTGCPATDGDGFTWQNGSRFHDTDNVDSKNSWSDNLHLKGPYQVDDMEQHFCMKTENPGIEGGVEWPAGMYCVFKYGGSCPHNMLSGSISWDDENTGNTNRKQGTLPSGVYDQNTRIDYCCMTGGNPSELLILPTQNPFYLFPYNSEQCHGVKGMTMTQEYFIWDQDGPGQVSGEHPHRVVSAGNLKISYCYYSVA